MTDIGLIAVFMILILGMLVLEVVGPGIMNVARHAIVKWPVVLLSAPLQAQSFGWSQIRDNKW